MAKQNTQSKAKTVKILIDKNLHEIAKDCERKVKIVLRDELEEQHRWDVQSTYAPIQLSGKKAQEYNESHSHQVARPYHHSGLLLRNIHGVIDGNVIKIEVADEKYEDGASTKDVYEWLSHGTNSESDFYILGGEKSHTPYVGYEPTPKHNFKQLTKQNMNNYIQNTLIPDIKNGKYLRKERKGQK